MRLKRFIKTTIPGQLLLCGKIHFSGYKAITSIGGKLKQYNRMMRYCFPEDYSEDDYFIYYINENIKLINVDSLLSNMPVDYSKIIKSGLYDLKTDDTNDIIKQNNYLVDLMIKYIKQILISLGNYQSHNCMRIKHNLESMLDSEAQTLSDACQRILIWNQFLWQTGHRLMGLGRLDKILEESYICGQRCNEDAEEIIQQFLKALHKYYKFKSAELVGDTGQVIELGGNKTDGNYFFNDLTLIFLKELRILHLPDPKIVLRVSDDTPLPVWNEAIKTMCSGIGNPLLSNDNVVAHAMCEYYNDIYVGFDYATTACWSPVALGCSISQCNPIMIQMLEPFLRVFEGDLDKLESFEEFLSYFYKEFDSYIDDYIADVNQIIWERDPILTFFTRGCIESNHDISEGGAKYNDYGMQSIGFPNLVNSLLNIKRYVYERKAFNLKEVKDILDSNYQGDEDYMKILNAEKCRFGRDEEYVVIFTNELLDKISQIISRKKNRFGRNFKFGISSSTYISDGKKTKASFDGRKSGMPLGVQISADQGIAYSEIANFASQLPYSSIFSNGNVMDLMIDKSVFYNDMNKLMSFLITCIQMGVFQIQINILSVEELMDAKKYPENHTNLIVRVWGFNAYFNDLPDEYKNLIIERAQNTDGF